MKKDVINDRYKDLCTKLGDLQIRRVLLDQNIEKVNEEIEELNKFAPLLRQIGAELESEIKSEAERKAKEEVSAENQNAPKQ